MINAQHLIFGLLVGCIGVIPPGLLNMTAAKLSVKQSRSAALIFALGASLVVIFQVYLGVFFSKILNENQDMLILLERLAVGLFIVLSVFFFIKATIDSSPEVEPTETKPVRLFFQGVILSALNIFPIPFYIAFSSFLAGKGLFQFRFPMAYLFILGAVSGTFFSLWIYIHYVQKFNFNSRTFSRKVHYILAVLTLAVALFTLFKIY